MQSLKPGRKDRVSQEGVKVSRGKSLLVAAIMDLITWSCETEDAAGSFTPMLPGMILTTLASQVVPVVLYS